MPRYLVTGGCGFIGSHLVSRLVDRGDAVIVLDNLSSGRIEHLDPRAELLVGSVTDPAVVERALRNVDGCFHLAAVASVAQSVKDWVGTHHTNLTGTIIVLNAARSQPSPVPVVYASSAAVYGDIGEKPLKESDRASPKTAYGADKLACETHAAVAWHQFGLATTGLRFFNVYGARQDPSSPYSGVISIFVDRISRGVPIQIHGDGSQVRDFIEVNDVVGYLSAAMKLTNEGGKIFNVCSGMPTSVLDLAQIIGSLVGRKPMIKFTAPRTGDIRTSIGSPAEAVHGLGVWTLTDIESGLRALCGLAPVQEPKLVDASAYERP